MGLDRNKLRNAILYICSHSEPAKLGGVKLHKVLYFSDMLHFAETGQPITGAVYRKRPFGPTCDSALFALRELEREGLLEVQEVDYFGYVKKEFKCKTDCDVTSSFGNSEVAMMNEVIDFVCNSNTAKTISDFSHTRAWDLVKFGDVISYSSVFHMFPTQASAETHEWAAAEVANLEAERSKGRSVARKLFPVLRDEVLGGSRH